MSSAEYAPRRTGLIVAAMLLGLILAGGVTILVVRPFTDMTSYYIAVAAVIVSPIFLLAAYLINLRGR
jgi:hypothetical protein